MKKVFSLLLCIVLLCGCANTNNTPPPAETVEPEEIASEIVVLDDNAGQTMITPEDDSWKYTVAQRLYNDFCYYYIHMYDGIPKIKYKEGIGVSSFVDSHIYYSAVMAADRATGISVYKDYLSENKIEYVRSKVAEINNNLGDASIPAFGYTKSGLHFMALAYCRFSDSSYAEDTCDKIRGIDTESAFVNEMYQKGGVSVYDFYVEDLTEKNEFIEMKTTLYDKGNSHKRKHKQITKLSETALGIVVKYGREIVPVNTTQIQNKSWNALCFEKEAQSCKIIVKSFGEVITLSDFIPEL